MVYLLLEQLLKKLDNLHIHVIIDNRNIKVTSEDSLRDYLNIELMRLVFKLGGELILILCNRALFIYLLKKQGLVKLNLDDFV